MEIARKYCTRCNRGIFTTWRTLDDQKYYHPHCFTCADCAVILESEVAKTTQNEIYCVSCYNDRLAYKMDARRFEDGSGLYRAKSSTRTFGQQTSTFPSSGHYSNGHKKPTDVNNNFDVIYSAPSPFFPNEQDEHSANGAMRNIKKKVKARKSEQGVEETKSKTLHRKKSKIPTFEEASNTTASPGTEHVRLVHKASRIPRPTSANSKKSLTTTTTAPQSDLMPPIYRAHLEKAKSSTLRPSPSPPQQRNNTAVTPKMHRSVSLFQPRKTETTSGTGNCSSVPVKSNKSTTYTRPRSAVSAAPAREEKSGSLADQQGVKTSISSSSNSKRQCAASFSSMRKKKESKARSKQQRNDNEQYPMNIYPFLKGGIPSTQAILTAIRREGSDAFKLKSSSRMQLGNNKESYDVLSMNRTINANNNAPCQPYISSLPKRSFNMTFECPICISSLVPGSTNNEKGEGAGGPDNKGQCRNVVTPCGHLFHANCMQNWLEIKGNKRCPICSALCLPETLQPVYLECNLCADLNPNPKALLVPLEYQGRMHEIDSSFRTLRSEYELLKAKYNAVLAENHNYSLNATLASSLQRAYDMECRHRLQLQWENRTLLVKIEELENGRSIS